MTKTELEARVEELELANENLAFDLAWDRIMYQKRLAACAPYKKSYKRGTQQPRTVKTDTVKKAKVERIPVDAFGQKVTTFSSQVLNSLIIGLIERGQYKKLEPKTLSEMTGGLVSPARFRSHLNWLKSRNYL